MPRPKSVAPVYSHHRPSGQAYARLPDGAGGRETVYLGPYESDCSRQEYARLVAELAATPSPTVAATPPPASGPSATVNEVRLAFWRHAERHYRRSDGSPTNELPQYRQTFRIVKDLYGRAPAAELGSRSLKAVRQKMIDAGWNRKLVNQRVSRVRRAFKWAASEELIPAGVYQALTTVPGLQAVLTAFAPPDPTDYFFSPRRSVEEFHAERSANRKTPRYRSHMARNLAKRAAAPDRLPAGRYAVTSYGQAIWRAVERANRRRERLAGAGNFDPVPAWHPNQLRHAHGTVVRHRYGLEAAQVALGHERADVTQVYAEKNLALAVRVAAEIG